jgi:esterase/lipase superfamily enzyme
MGAAKPSGRGGRGVGSAVVWPLVLLAGLTLTLTTSGCGGPQQLMPTPTLYTMGGYDPFAEVPAELRTTGVDVLYLTDRQRDPKSTAEAARYGYERSRSLSFGISHVQFGKGLTWEQLAAESRTAHRSKKVGVSTTRTAELVRFPPTPRTLVALSPAGGEATTRPTGASSAEGLSGTFDDEALQSLAKVQAQISASLAKSPTKDVYLYIHGYANDFEGSVRIIAQLWHFLGRNGVAMAYSWPAGSPGLLRGYTYDFASSQFTVYHLKQVLRYMAQNPDVHRIHILAHSRGTDVAVTALSELHLEIAASGRSTREVLKLGSLVLAAADLDVDVLFQRAATARLGQVPERAAIYICAKDKALGLSDWLFGGVKRLGKLQANIFTPEELQALRASSSLQIVDARISEPGPFGHSYFHENPAVSSDLMLLMRYHLRPGPEHGRPLRADPDGFWVVDDKYPHGETRPDQWVADGDTP